MVAALAKIIARDESWRSKVIKIQRYKRNSFLPELVQKHLNNLVTQMEEVFP
jgi:hypothetical protein